MSRYTYDASWRTVAVQDPEGNITRTEYDKAGNRTAQIDPLDIRRTFSYDSLNRIIQTTYPDGTFMRIGYDAEGNRASSTDQQGRTAVYSYDANKNLIGTTYPDGTTVSYGYDAAGRQTSVTDALGSVSTKAYDSLGREIRSSDAEGNVTSYAYDFAGNVVGRTDPMGLTTAFEYDANKRLARTTLPGGQTTGIAYDHAGRKTSDTDAAGNVTAFGYDAIGNLTSVTDALNNTTRYEYDAQGNRTAIVDARGNRTTFAYDRVNRLVTKTMPNGGSESYTYDAAGRTIIRTDALNQTIQYAYDSVGRLVSRSYPDTSSVRFAYTPTGKRTSALDKRGTTTYSYDSRDRLTQMTYPDGQSIGYAYDLNGRLQTLSSLAGTVTYAYSSCCGRLQSVTDPQGRSTTLSYDANGNRTGLSYPNGTSVSYGYDMNNSLTQLTHRNSIGQVMASYAYTLGPIGNRTRIDESDGIVRQYEYDKLYRLTKERVTDPANVQTYQDTFSYDAVGNRLNRSHDSVSTAYTYNNADQLITENGVTYMYDLNGNLESRTDGTGTTRYSYDFDGRLVKVTSPQSVVTYAYDADGSRVEATTQSGTVRYLVDTNRQLSQVLAEYMPSGSLLASYVYADDLISMTRGGKTSYYHFDGLGSTRLLTDNTGAVTDTYAYDAFGNLIAKTGTTDNPFLFTGQQHDANIGFYYLRARYYQPTTGRFIALDPWVGYSCTPMSLHKYLYAADNPVNYVDPGGEQYSIAEASATVSIIETLVSIALPITMAATIICSAVFILSAAGYDPGGPANLLPCEFPDQEIVVYRGLNATNPGSFRFDADGLSTFETLPPGYKCAFPFTLRFKGIKRPGRIAKVIAPVPPGGGTGMYAPPPPGHWLLNYPGNIEDTKKALSFIAKSVCK